MTDMRNRLIKLLDNRIAAEFIQDTNRAIADYLIENGAVLPNYGKWEYIGTDKHGNVFRCSQCCSRIGLERETDYCPHCGAKMDGGNIKS